MRWNLLKSFDKIYIIDLHGNAKKKETAPNGGKDENVFDIQQGVSINIFIKRKEKANEQLAEVLHYDLYGLREEKYQCLFEYTLDSVLWQKIEPQLPQYFFLIKDFGHIIEYEKGFSVQELFQINSLGLITKRDNLSISFSNNEQIEKLTYFLDENNPIGEVCKHFAIPLKDNDKWDAVFSRKNTNISTAQKNITTVLYRPFDARSIFYNDYFVARLNKKVLRHLQNNNNAIIIGRQGQAVGNAGGWNIVYMTNRLADQNIFYRGGGTVFPLYLYPEKGHRTIEGKKRKPNLNMKIVTKISSKLGLVFESEKSGGKDKFAPIDLLDYIYAVLHSPQSR
jgi:predicted helicase